MSDAALDGTWIVTAFRSDDELVPVVSFGREPTLLIAAGHISGTMGVNRLVGRLEDGVVSGPMATTRMAGPPELMRQEDELLAHLHGADELVVDERGMTVAREGLTLIELRRSGTNRPDESS